MAHFFNLIYLVILVILSLGRTEVTSKDEASIKKQAASTFKTNISIIEAPILEVPSTVSKEHEKKIKITTYPLKEDSNVDLQLFWLGEKADTQLLLTTYEIHAFITHFTRPSVLYRSKYGEAFENIQSEINSTNIRKFFGIMKSPVNPNKLILISYQKRGIFDTFRSLFSKGKVQQSVLVITEDAGKTFHTVELPFIIRENVPFEFHPTKENWIIALEEQKTVMSISSMVNKVYGQAWITKDFGKTWRKMMSGYIAESVKWGATNREDDIYLATHQHGNSIWHMFESMSRMTLWKSHDGGHFFEEIIEHMYSFGVQGGFVYASVNFTESEDDKKVDRRVLHVSTDHGKTFHVARVPDISNDMFYAVVEMHKGTMFVHVDELGDSGKGKLYVSGADGIMYTKSLDDHFYTNTGFTDFYRVESMQGVYITQQLKKDLTMRSMISFDRGVKWQPLTIKKEYCKNMTVTSCSLHIHNVFSQVRHYQYNPPLSLANAPGIILVHGNAGDALTGVGGVWMSRDGGYTWTKIAKGGHHYAIGDSGNLIVLVPHIGATGSTLIYSLNQGRVWHHMNYDRYAANVTISGLATEPHSRSRMFSLWGHHSQLESDKTGWVTFTISFKDLLNKQCDMKKDMKTWYPHIKNGKDGCFLGEKIVHWIPYKDILCYLGPNFNATKKIERCNCTKEDLECDYGYEKDQSGDCKKDETIPPLEVCKDGEEMIEKFSVGYRRIPGDVCESKYSMNDIVNFIDEKKKCKPKKEEIEGIITEEKNEIRVEEMEAEEKKEKLAKQKIEMEKANERKQKSKLVLVLLCVVLVCGIAGLSGYWFLKRRQRGRNVHKVLYDASSLDGIEVLSPADGSHTEKRSKFDPRPKSHREYHDETDAEDDALLLP